MELMGIRLNLFPASVITDQGAIAGRAFLQDDRLLVYTDGGGRQIVVAKDEAVTAIEAGEYNADATYVTLASGETWTIVPSGTGCGCGSPLKTFDPALHGLDPPS